MGDEVMTYTTQQGRRSTSMTNEFQSEQHQSDPRHDPGRLWTTMSDLAGDAGKVLHAEMRGRGWMVVFDTEYAALKVHYKYLGTPNLRLGKALTFNGYYVATNR